LSLHEPHPVTAFTQQSKRATIIGGSIAGLTTGLALLQHGWDVQIFEATKGDMQSRGAGIITHASLFAAMEKLGVAKQEDIGVPIITRKAFDKTGAIESELELRQIASSWGRLYQLLQKQFPLERYNSSIALTDIVQKNDVVEAHFSDGRVESSDLLVAADGIRSTARKILEPGSNPEYAGYVAWRGLIDEQDLTAQEQSELFPYFTFCLPEGEQVLSYPIAGELHEIVEGKRRCNVVWYRPADRESTLTELLTDIDGNNNGESIAPDKIRPAVIEKMQQEATQLLSPQHASFMKRLDQPFIQPIYDLTTNSMAHGRIAILGDAAFTARPHLGVGITKAAEDSLALAQALKATESITEAVQQFDNQRRKVGKNCVDQSRELGAYLQAQLKNADERRFAENHRTIEAVMRETASLVSLQ